MGYVSNSSEPSPNIECPTCGRPVLDVTATLTRISIPNHYLDCLPKELAHENNVVPFDERNGVLILLLDINRRGAGLTFEEYEKLRFILNCRLAFLHADADVIRDAIDRHYCD